MIWLLLHPAGHPWRIPRVPKETGNEIVAQAKEAQWSGCGIRSKLPDINLVFNDLPE
ncbi:MAG TPA: hypothetical protein VJY15_26790 [Candidatus Acidoferrum sp.]|nr:hypothetical protein [Candidatus Acidoferrum sp.]